MRSSDIILVLIAIIFPPLAALLTNGCGCSFILNVLLTILGYLPGHLHAFWLIYCKINKEEHSVHHDPEAGGYGYHGQSIPQHQHQHSPLPPSQPLLQPQSTPAGPSFPPQQELSDPPPSYGATLAHDKK